MSEVDLKTIVSEIEEESCEEKKKDPIVVTVKYNVFFATALCYLMLPVLMFFIFFLKLGWAILFSGALVAAFYFCLKNQKKSNYTLLADRSNEVKISPFLLVFMGIFAVGWAYISGIGEFAWATADHTVRAAVLNDLVNYKWPVVYDMSTQMNPAVAANLPEGKAMFAYYFTFWMVPAGVGKMFGIVAARVALVIWSAIGLYLTMLGLCIIQKKASWVAPFFFIFFGGVDIVPYIIQNNILNVYTTWEGWNSELWVHGHFYQTMNTFHQCIPGWLIIVLILDTRNNKDIGTLGSLMFCYSPWATIGLLPIAFYELFKGEWGAKTIKDKAKSALTYGNLALPVIVFMVFALFYTSNSEATAIKGFIWTFFDGVKPLLLVYIGYVIVEFGVWSALIFKDNVKNPLFYVALITLLIFPIYKMSEANDLLMRGTLAPMAVIFILSLKYLDKVIERFKKRGKNNDFKALGVFAVVFATAMVPFFFMTTEFGATRQILTGEDKGIQPQDKIVSFGNIVNEEYTEVTKRQFYVFEYENKPFYRFFGKS